MRSVRNETVRLWSTWSRREAKTASCCAVRFSSATGHRLNGGRRTQPLWFNRTHDEDDGKSAPFFHGETLAQRSSTEFRRATAAGTGVGREILRKSCRITEGARRPRGGGPNSATCRPGDVRRGSNREFRARRRGYRRANESAGGNAGPNGRRA